MKEILKVKIAQTPLAIEPEAYTLLEGFFEAVDKKCGSEETARVESRFVELVLAKQSANTVITKALIEELISTIGVMEYYTPKSATPTDTPKTTTAPLVKLIAVCAKILLGIFLAGWFLVAIGLLIGFVWLIAIGTQWNAVVIPDGLSPVVFAGLVCAVVVLFMGIVGDVGLSVLRSKPINLSRLCVGTGIWVIFLVWMTFATVRNIDDWSEWAYRSERQIELWEEELEEWEERVEREWEETLLQLEGINTWQSTHTFELEGIADIVGFEIITERFEEIEPYEDRVVLRLLKGEKVTITISNNIDGDRCFRSVVITTSDGDKTFTTPLPYLPAQTPNNQ